MLQCAAACCWILPKMAWLQQHGVCYTALFCAPLCFCLAREGLSRLVEASCCMHSYSMSAVGVCNHLGCCQRAVAVEAAAEARSHAHPWAVGGGALCMASGRAETQQRQEMKAMIHMLQLHVHWLAGLRGIAPGGADMLSHAYGSGNGSHQNSTVSPGVVYAEQGCASTKRS